MKPYSDKWRTACRVMLGKTLNPAQAAIEEWWSSSDSRFVLLLGGERAGKSFKAAALAMQSMDIEQRGEYWIVGPDYYQARPEFLYIYDAFKNAELVDDESVSMPVNVASPWTFTTIWGQTWRTKSASDIQKLASFSVSGVIMAEAAQHIYESYLKLLGRVSQTRGFLILAGTLERGLPWYADLYKRWQGPNELGARSFSLPSWSNIDIYPGGYDDKAMIELRSEFPDDLFMERFGAEPMRKFGLVLPEFDISTHVKRLELNIDLPVELWMDPGQHCYPVLFVQNDGLVTNVLDCLYSRNRIVQDIIPEVMANPLFSRVDARNGGVIDNAGKQHQANKSQIELWQEIAGISLRANYVKLDVTIATIRFRLGSVNPLHMPLLYFNDHFKNTKSPDGLAMDILAEPELWVWPDRGPGRNQAVTPVDKNNDAMKAIGYGLVEKYGGYVTRKVQNRGRRRAYFI